MLKFFRKYQLFIMIIGGSLLMVVFLLQPVLTRLAPSTEKKTVATVGATNEKISTMDREIANANFGAVRNVVPALFSPYFIALDPQSPGDHWLLLSREAEANGLIGEAGDGKSWAPQLSQIMAQFEARAAMAQQFGSVSGLSPQLIDMLLSQPQAQQDIATRADLILDQFPLFVSKATASNPYLKTLDDTYRALAQARGILRLLALHRTAARRSVPESNVVINNALDGVAIDLLLLQPDLLASSITEPTEEQLQAHFDQFKDFLPADSEFGIGYVLQPRVKLEYLKLDAAAIAAAVQVDRVEIMKRFMRSPTLYADSLDAPSLTNPVISTAQQIEQQIRTELTETVMVNADRAARGIMLTATRTLTKQKDGTLIIPDGWTAPTLEEIALELSQTIKLPSGDPLPLPIVQRHASSWLAQADVAALPDFGASAFRVGATGFRAEVIPQVTAQYLDSGVLNELLPVQVGVPYVSNAATDNAGNRYFINVLEARSQSAAQDIDEAGRETVLNDYTQIQAFNALVEASQGYLDVARTSELEGLAAQFSETTPPQTAQNIIFRESQQNTQSVPAWATAANTQDARDSVLAAARERLTPLQGPDSIDPLDAYMTVQLKATRSIAVIKLIARRPLTADQSLRQGFSILQAQSNADLIAVEGFQDKFPYSFTAMKRRHQFVLLAEKKAEEEAAELARSLEQASTDDADQSEQSQTAQPAG